MHEIISPPLDISIAPFSFQLLFFFSLPPPLLFSAVVRYRRRPETGSIFSDRDDDAYRVIQLFLLLLLLLSHAKLVETSVYRGRVLSSSSSPVAKLALAKMPADYGLRPCNNKRGPKVNSEIPPLLPFNGN